MATFCHFFPKKILCRIRSSLLFLGHHMAKFCAKTKYCLDVGRSHFFGILLGWVPIWGRYWIFVMPASSGYLKKLQHQRTISSRYMKISRFKKPPGLGFFVKSDSKNHRFWVFQKLQRTTGFPWKTGKDPVVFRWPFDFFPQNLRTLLTYCNLVFDFLIIVIVYQNWVFDFFFNYDYQLWYPTRFGAISNTFPTLVPTSVFLSRFFANWWKFSVLWGFLSAKFRNNLFQC